MTTDTKDDLPLGIKPNTFDEAVRAIRQHIEYDAIETEAIRQAEDVDALLAEAHHGFGRAIRNGWGLWSGGPLRDDMERLGFMHPDDMSTAILRRALREIRKEEYDLEADVLFYRSYWDQLS